jgi:CRP/FNR family transcriptional regulator, cyclic AMP receptor protein
VTQLTHEQIAAMTGTSRVTVTRTLQRLREQGRIAMLEGHILLLGKRGSAQTTEQSGASRL